MVRHCCMGDHPGWATPSGLLPNGLLPNEVASVTRSLDMARWSIAEERTAELISCIQPNQPYEERRNAVADYVQRLIMKSFSCQVKIIKCLVENVVVDISFNQVGGLCTLCFLEEVDHLINQHHLFKRSIILIKAWCYYESRILGAHHGLISTYALETLVLYIFHVFNNSFAGPLEVLYRFLEFFSNFDWGNFCVSLWGPVPISSLPDMTGGMDLIQEQPFQHPGESLGLKDR